MKRILIPIFLISLLVFAGCSSDDNGGTNPPPVDKPPRPVAVVKATAPSMTNANDPIWNDVDSAEVDLARAGAAKMPVGKSAVVTDKANVQAIINGTKLYLRFTWEDDSLHILKDYWYLSDPDNFNFTRRTDYAEDQLIVLFDGLPSNAMDVWYWRALTTGAGNLAEGFNYAGGVFTRDAGAEVVAKDNAVFGDNSRPKYVHKDGSNFTGLILYQTDTVATSTFVGGTLWPDGFIVPGWYIDSTVASRTLSGPQKQSRWDIQATSIYSAEANRLTLVLSRELNTGYTDDLDLSALDSVQIKMIVIDNQDDPLPNNNSNQSSSDLFWLIL